MPRERVERSRAREAQPLLPAHKAVDTDDPEGSVDPDGECGIAAGYVDLVPFTLLCLFSMPTMATIVNRVAWCVNGQNVDVPESPMHHPCDARKMAYLLVLLYAPMLVLWTVRRAPESRALYRMYAWFTLVCMGVLIVLFLVYTSPVFDRFVDYLVQGLVWYYATFLT